MELSRLHRTHKGTVSANQHYLPLNANELENSDGVRKVAVVASGKMYLVTGNRHILFDVTAVTLTADWSYLLILVVGDFHKALVTDIMNCHFRVRLDTMESVRCCQ